MAVAGFCLDIAGVLTDNGRLLPGAQAAIALLEDAGLPYRLLTNTSRRPAAAIHAELLALGLIVDADHLISAPQTLANHVRTHRLRPYLIIHPDIAGEFAGIEEDEPNAVVLCDAAEQLDYAHLDRAFELLLAGAPLLAVGMNRYFQGPDRLHLDAGPFIRALEYASGVQAHYLGKPGGAMFDYAVSSMGLTPDQVWMIGDDVDADAQGALSAGLHACLVRTGKYRPGDETRLGEHDLLLADDVLAAVRQILSV